MTVKIDYIKTPQKFHDSKRDSMTISEDSIGTGSTSGGRAIVTLGNSIEFSAIICQRLYMN